MHASDRSRSTKSIRFSIDKEHYRRIEVEPGVVICHLYPTLCSWVGRETPDDVNPRSHDDHAMKGSVPKAIEDTIRRNSRDFYLANRGETILAESISFDPDKKTAEIVLTEWEGETASHGIADGGTTDAVIARVQREVGESLGLDFARIDKGNVPEFLREARVHLEVIVGVENRDRIIRLVQGRNTSRQVKPWTIADFEGAFGWIKDILECDDSPFKGRIGYEENSAAPVDILEVLAILTLFHPLYDGRDKAPTVAYSSKGRMDKRLTASNTADGYKLLSPILIDILKLHDEIIVAFPEMYQKVRPGGKLGRWGKTDERLFPKVSQVLPLTGAVANRDIPTGVLYPLLASLRALVQFPKAGGTGKAKWRIPPMEFFQGYGGELIEILMNRLSEVQSNPQTLGKTKSVYTGLHDRARLLVLDSQVDAE